MQQVHIIGGGTVFHIRPHLALSAPAYGKVVRNIEEALYQSDFDGIVHSYTTKMAGNRHQVWTARSGRDDSESKNLETNADIADLLHELMIDPKPKVIFLPAALCDFSVPRIDTSHGGMSMDIGTAYKRLHTSDGDHFMTLRPAEKIISRVRKFRKDIFLVGFKTTTGASSEEQFEAGLRLVKQASCNLVLANDLETKVNMVVTPEQAAHYVSTDRQHTIRQLVGMTLERSKGHFTRSEVVPGKFVGWTGEVVPASLRTVVDHCIKRGAYRPFMGKTVGHFAFKVGDGAFVTSRRGVDFNRLDEVGMVSVMVEGDDKVVAIGGKPSVGGQSQRIIFADHPDVDCIVHFHCPMKGDRHANLVRGDIPLRSQEPYECGSHECGKNTSDGLKVFDLYNGSLKYPVKAVMLEKHGPNIVFNKNIDPQFVIDFIEKHWDLERQTSEDLS